MAEQYEKPQSPSGFARRLLASVTLVVLGLLTGLVALALVSNQFGNTDTAGLILLVFSGWLFTTGVCSLFLRFAPAALLGVVAAPLPAVLLFIVFWLALFVTAFQNRHHQDFAANGVSQIPPAAQMDELFDDCRHYITYGANHVPLFNSVAYFGGRYELAMQVPVAIESKTSGSMSGDPRFYLNEVSAVRISPSGGVGASFSRDLKFGYEEWKRVYKADGDFSTIGFNVNPTPVANFQKFTDAARPSN